MKYLPLLLSLFLLAQCKSGDKKEGADAFFPVASFLKGQVKALDSSLATFTKIESFNGKTDSVVISRQDAQALARDFMQLPPIDEDDYTETEQYDDLIQQVVINQMPKDQNATIQRQAVLIQPGPIGEEDKVKTIIIDQLLNDKAGPIQKNMMWEVDQKFQITTVTPQGPRRLQVIWADGSMPR